MEGRRAGKCQQRLRGKVLRIESHGRGAFKGTSKQQTQQDIEHLTYHSINVVDRIGARSLISQAAGKPVARTTRPMIRKVQGGPSFCNRPSTAKLMAVPPSPPPAYTIPLASPRFLLKY